MILPVFDRLFLVILSFMDRDFIKRNIYNINNKYTLNIIIIQENHSTFKLFDGSCRNGIYAGATTFNGHSIVIRLSISCHSVVMQCHTMNYGPRGPMTMNDARSANDSKANDHPSPNLRTSSAKATEVKESYGWQSKATDGEAAKPVTRYWGSRSVSSIILISFSFSGFISALVKFISFHPPHFEVTICDLKLLNSSFVRRNLHLSQLFKNKIHIKKFLIKEELSINLLAYTRCILLA